MAKPTLLLTRPVASSIRFATRLDAAVPSQAELLISPLLEIVPMDAPTDLTNISEVIFSSANGVAHGPEGNERVAHCVGARTAEAAQAKGWQVGEIAQDADQLVMALIDATVTSPLLHLCGRFQRGDIAERLTKVGVQTTRIEIYDQRLLPLTDAAQVALCGEGPVVLPLFSPRTAAYLVQQAKGFGQVYVIAMSAAVAQELGEISMKELQTLPEPTADAMVSAVELLLGRDSFA